MGRGFNFSVMLRHVQTCFFFQNVKVAKRTMDLDEQVLDETFKKKNLPGSGKFVRFGSCSCCQPSWLVCAGRARGHGLGAWVLRCSSGNLATLGVSSFSGLGEFCFGS